MSKFMKRITAREAQRNYIMTSKNVFEIAADEVAQRGQKAAVDKMKQVISLTKILVQRNGVPFAKAVKIAKRAYRMGVRSVFAN